MRRIQEKVKDLVQVRSFSPLPDLYTNTEAALENYRFTDGTSMLMANWLNAVSRVSYENGIALALAGYRGVGKSHFLAAFDAIVSKPEFRTKLTDGHVAASAQSLMRRHYPVIRVWRGSKDTFKEELRDAVVAAFGTDVQFQGDSTESILKAAASKWSDVPLVVIVDTAMDRSSRVARDDGPFLGELAEIARASNIVVCAALDDDIAGADGTNSAISRMYQIDFLDQEHLYKVVDLHIFPKNNNVAPVISEIYDFFKGVVPNFRWSAQRFSSLYPLHPGILEIAPYVRLFVHDFALLSFAAEAGERILGRPANSLIALDEVFDKAEGSLRKIDDLKEAFAAYDKLNTEVVSKVPVMQRLQAKLVLKALLLLSLDGRGATAEDICASMLIFDEAEPDKAVSSVKSIIGMFSSALPDEVSIQTVADNETLYSFRVSSKDGLNSALQDAASKLDVDVIPGMIRRIMQERFSDFTLSSTVVGGPRNVLDCVTVWRGGHRRGRLVWNDSTITGNATSDQQNDSVDWEVIAELFGSERNINNENDGSKVVWKPDDLRPEEINTLLRYHILQTDNEINENYGENVRASLHSHRIACEKIVERSLLDNGKLIIDGFDYNFTDEARESETLNGLLSIMLEPLFETRYPEHPNFTEPLGMAEVSRFVSDFYSGARQDMDEVQALAKTFGLPMKLVKQVDELFVPETGEVLESLPLASKVLNLVGTDGNTTLADIYSELRKSPFGLVREAQHLVLAALVADRRIEFVTNGGDRINSRSLDLRIIWDEIAGIVKTKENAVSSKGLIKWAVLITGDSGITSLSSKADTERLKSAYVKWLADWDSQNLLGRFDKVADTHINTRVWTRISRLRSSFGAIASDMRNALAGTAAAEDPLYRAISLFSDSEDELAKCQELTKYISSFLDACDLRDVILPYIATAEYTNNKNIEKKREALLTSLESAIANSAEARNRESKYLWDSFRREFSDHFGIQHNLTMLSHDLQEKFDNIKRTDMWFEFESLSDIPMLRGASWEKAWSLKRQLDQLNCKFDITKALDHSPTCVCSFRLSDVVSWQETPSELWSAVSNGLIEARAVLSQRSDAIINRLELFAAAEPNTEHAEAANQLSQIFRAESGVPKLSGQQLEVLGYVLDSLSSFKEEDNDDAPKSFPFINTEPNVNESDEEKDLLDHGNILIEM